MKALVLAVAIAASELEDAPLRRTATRDKERRGRAERNRFSEQDLMEMFGDMEPTPPEEPKPALVMPEPDFIRWEPGARRDPEPDAESLAA